MSALSTWKNWLSLQVPAGLLSRGGDVTTVFPMEFLPWENRVAFPEESQLRQCRATQSTARVGYFRASIIHRTQTWTTGSLTCAQMLMHAIAHGVYGHT